MKTARPRVRRFSCRTLGPWKKTCNVVDLDDGGVRRLLLCGGNATLLDYTGLDGCGWVLESDGGVEPINLESFLNAPKTG